jgi:hypothetical protein
MKHSIWNRYGFAWVTLALFLITLTGHWIFGWFSYVQEQQDHGKSIEVAGYTVQMLRDTLENWQSEFLQLLWQVAGPGDPATCRFPSIQGRGRPH